MKTEASLEALYTDLIQNGLPADHAKRSVEELTDHHSDLVDSLCNEGHSPATANAEAAARLGEPKRLAKKIVRDFRRRSFAGRFPLITFLFGPLVALALGWAAVVLIFAGVGILLDKWFGIVGGVADGHLSMADQIAFFAGWFFLMLVVPGAVAAWSARLIGRAGMKSIWAGIACLLIAIPAGVPAFSIDVDKARGLVAVPMHLIFVTPSSGFLSACNKWYSAHPSTLLQMLLPLAVGAAVVLYDTRRRRNASMLAWSVEGAESTLASAAA